MTKTLSKHQKNLSAIIHAATFSKYVIPFGNFIVPLILWTAYRNDHQFIDQNGKQVLNFQISLLLYSFVIGILTVPFFLGFLPNIFHHGLFNLNHINEFNGLNFNFSVDQFKFLWPLGIAGFALVGLFIVNIVYTILGTIRTSEGINFKYPITINFIK
ncbi:hypothetical protein KCTC52924_00104 [Arenibacter antarcticus]|uniref:DUF4870 domain-containing protein n=1 Tax=Arenibacter antarcticus TaxID=2040469 RepID=A0ABW5VJG2_9FLAO|nr:DUF4870 domain-containing protein [Arenibacter sp. H213]MCM4169129.1 DUF4870 domain-containing protein [Arenibacter sp. H213]